MASLNIESVVAVHHWTPDLFSFKTTRSQYLRFDNGHFVMIGLRINGRPLLRAYSIVSANYEAHLEFFSIKVPEGQFTSRLQHIQPGDEILVSTKPTGTLITSHLLPGKRLYLMSTGTGLAPFLSIIKDPDIYEQFETIVLVHGCRQVQDLAYADMIQNELPKNDFFGQAVKDQLRYYPTVTREAFINCGRITHLLNTGQLCADLNLPNINPKHDRFMLCGSPNMLKECGTILNANGFQESRHGQLGHYVIERAFVEK